GPEVGTRRRIEVAQARTGGGAALARVRRPPLQQLQIDAAVARTGAGQCVRTAALSRARGVDVGERGGATVRMRPGMLERIVHGGLPGGRAVGRRSWRAPRDGPA